MKMKIFSSHLLSSRNWSRGSVSDFKRMGRSLNMIMRQIGLILLVFSLLMGICDGAEENIYKIMILGNVKVEEGVIRGAIKSREGGPFPLKRSVRIYDPFSTWATSPMSKWISNQPRRAKK